MLAIDPGTTHSAYVVWDGQKLIDSGFVPNGVLRCFVDARLEFIQADAVAIEMVACYGMPVGREVFETCLFIGRLQDAFTRKGKPPRLVYRLDVKTHLCHSARAKDGNVRQALIDKHGEVGTKKKPGPLYGVYGHLWAALAVADYALSVPSPTA